jgi:hypothetical protein
VCPVISGFSSKRSRLFFNKLEEVKRLERVCGFQVGELCACEGWTCACRSTGLDDCIDVL